MNETLIKQLHNNRVEQLMDQLWGKSDPYETLIDHSDKTVQVMSALAEFVPEKFDVIATHFGIDHNEALSLASYLAGVHDIGKAVPIWQGSESAPERHRMFYRGNSNYLVPEEFFLYRGYRHERGSFQILCRIWNEEGIFDDRKIQRNLAAVVLTHHQKTGANNTDDPVATTKAKCGANCPIEWIECQKTFEKYYRNKYRIEKIQIKGGDMDAPCMVLSGLLMFSDWMASSLGAEPYETELDRSNFSQKVRKHLVEMGIHIAAAIPDNFHEMWPWIYEMRPLQKIITEVAEQDLPLLTIIEDSMGAGKTEAALFLANHIQKKAKKAGIYIALPTSATANQMHQRVDELLNRFDMNGSRLLHGTAWLTSAIDSDELSSVEKFLAPTRMGLFAPYGVGTIDQVLMAILKIKYGNLRMTGISDKVLILDEVHAYDAYMSEELKVLLKWCKKLAVPVIMLSATLPEEKRKEYVNSFSEELLSDIGYPRVTTVNANGVLKEYQITEIVERKQYSVSLEPIMQDEEAIVALAMDTVKNGGTLCLNVNTVSRAINLAKKLDAMKSDIEVFLFHSRYTMARRNEIEDECIKMFGKDTSYRPTKAILVATQVVEQSLDIDFDYYITDICPIDLVLQRLGRQFRHKETKRPCATPSAVILVPDDSGDYGASKYIYMEYLLDKTRDVLEHVTHITVPDSIQEMVDKVYCSNSDMQGKMKKYQEMILKEAVSKGMTNITALKSPQKYFQFGKGLYQNQLFDVEASSRLSKPSVRVAVLPNHLYKKGIEGKLSREEQVIAFSYSFSLTEGSYDFKGLSQGERMLKGVYLMSGGSANYKPTESAKCDRIVVDSRYGIMISKG